MRPRRRRRTVRSRLIRPRRADARADEAHAAKRTLRTPAMHQWRRTSGRKAAYATETARPSRSRRKRRRAQASSALKNECSAPIQSTARDGLRRPAKPLLTGGRAPSVTRAGSARSRRMRPGRARSPPHLIPRPCDPAATLGHYVRPHRGRRRPAGANTSNARPSSPEARTRVATLFISSARPP